MTERTQNLSDKEKETLRLLLRGYDAKSTAKHLSLSVHTVNERLRDARRKLSVSSSREAARLLRDSEGDSPQMLGDKRLGDAGQEHDPAGHGASGQGHALIRFPLVKAGVAIMSLVLAIYALSSFTTLSSEGAASSISETAAQTQAEQSAQQWLALVDAAKWDESWASTAASFRKLNTAKVWASVSEKVRVPLGTVRSRVFVNSQDVPAPPNGYTMLKFRTNFASKAGATETLTLVREAGGWKVTGYIIE